MRLFPDPKRLFPLLVSGIAGFLVLASIVEPNTIANDLLQLAQIITAVGLALGLLNVLGVHLRYIRTRTPHWPHSITLMGAAIAVLVLELLPSIEGGAVAAQAAQASSQLFQYVYEPLAGSVLALLTFFALRASWRALQARPGEALVIVLAAAAFLVAAGPWARTTPGLQAGLDWVQAYPVLGVTRGLLFGVAIGATVASVRLLLGFDQPYLDR